MGESLQYNIEQVDDKRIICLTYSGEVGSDSKDIALKGNLFTHDTKSLLVAMEWTSCNCAMTFLESANNHGVRCWLSHNISSCEVMSPITTDTRRWMSQILVEATNS